MLIFAACYTSLAGKGFALLHYTTITQNEAHIAAATMAFMLLPGLLLGVASVWHRGILKTFLTHPSIILLPTFTHFTVACNSNKSRERVTTTLVAVALTVSVATIALAALISPMALTLFLLSGLVGIVVIWRHDVFKDNSIKNLPAFAYFASTPSKEMEGKKKKEEEEATATTEVPFIAFSSKLTIANILLSTAGHIAFIHILADWSSIHDKEKFLIPTAGIVLTVQFLSNCCCNSPAIEYGALVPTLPHLPFVLECDMGGRLRAVPDEKKVKLEEMNGKEIWSMVFNRGEEEMKSEVNQADEEAGDNPEEDEAENNRVVLIHMEPLPAKVVPYVE